MAKNISLWGASYPDVPAVNLPKTGGGTATFVDQDGVASSEIIFNKANAPDDSYSSFSLISGKKFSDYRHLLFILTYDGDDSRDSSFLPCAFFCQANRSLFLQCLSGSAGDDLSTVQIMYISDTSFQMKATHAKVVKGVIVYGFK